jgi:thymidylate synthase
MKINPRIKTAEDLATLTYEDFTLEWYDPHPAIKGDITVVGGV